MGTLLSRTDTQVEHIRGLYDACMLLAPTTLRRMGYKVDGSLVSLSESGRSAQDIILVILRGVSMACSPLSRSAPFEMRHRPTKREIVLVECAKSCRM
jgi:hypothetical protein